jgi:hypothetical protein
MLGLFRNTLVEHHGDVHGAPTLADFDAELKFAIDGRDATPVRRWLQSVCLPDPVFPTGIVWTIYYDTPTFQHLLEKVNSDYLKTKLRLRWYDDRVDRPARSFLEAKFRIGLRRHKVRAETPYAGSWLAGVPLHDLILRQLPQCLRPQGVPVGSALRPVLLVRYTRDRFVDPVAGVRISLDANISVPSVNREVLPTPHPLPLATAVVEVKGKVTDLPAVLRYLIDLGGRRVSFSKYRACYDHTVIASH